MPANVSRPKLSIEILLGSGTDLGSITVATGILIVDSNNAQKRLQCVLRKFTAFSERIRPLEADDNSHIRLG
jgi:hypothetical protein